MQNTKTGAFRENKGALKKEEKYVFSVELYAQDYSLSLSNQVVKVNLHQDSGEMDFFRGIKIAELLKKKDLQEKVWQTLINFLKFNVWLECLLAFNPQGLLEIQET